MEEKTIVPFRLEQNENGSWAVIENPDSNVYGHSGWLGDRVVRSPFASREEARAREEEIAAHWEYKVILVD